MNVTKFLINSLMVIASVDDYRVSARQFARLIKPDSPAWSRVYNTGPNGACSGKGMWLWAGSYLSKLVYAGYVYRHYDEYCCATYGLLNKGWELLRNEGKIK